MTITEFVLHEVGKLVSIIENIDAEYASEDALHSQNISSIRSKNSTAASKETQSLNGKLNQLKRKKDDDVQRYVVQINAIKFDESKLAQVFPRSKVDFSKVIAPTQKYDEKDAQNLIEELSKTDFWSWLMRLFSGRSREIEAGELYLRIDNAIKYLNSKIADAESAYETEKRRIQQTASITSKQRAQLHQNDISREETRHHTQISILDRKKQAFIKNPNLNALRQRVEDALLHLDGGADGWKQYKPSSSIPAETLLGRILVPCTVKHPDPRQVELLRAIPYYVEKRNGFAVPYTIQTIVPLLMLCETEANTADAAEIYRQYVCRLVRFMPKKSFRAYFADPVNRGRSLGSLIHLSAQNNGCGICEYQLSSRNITEMLGRLTDHVDAICRKLTSVGCSDIHDYNKRINKNRIPYTVVVIHDFPSGFDSQSIDALRVLINQAKQCGVSILISHKQTDTLEGNALQFIQSVYDQFTTLNYSNGQCFLNSKTLTMPMQFLPIDIQAQGRFFEDVNKLYNYTPPLDNRFTQYIPQNNSFQQRSAIKGLDIPFAIDSDGKLKELSIGYDQNAYGFISGGVGSGKTTLLNTLIVSAIAHYSPDELELWLVDYKVTEFGFYVDHCPNHARYIIADDSVEISYSIIDEIKAEIIRRRRLFFDAKVKDFVAYRAIAMLPRILVIIDEFHCMSRAVAAESDYKSDLEYIFRVARSHGITILLCNQFMSGLNGLTSDAAQLIATRIAMRSTAQDDIRNTLMVSGHQIDENLSKGITNLMSGVVGSLIYRYEMPDPANPFSNKVCFDTCRSLYVSESDRINYIESINQNDRIQARRHDIFVGASNHIFSFDDISDFEARYRNDMTNNDPFYIGSPLGVGKCFYFNMSNEQGEDLLMIGNDRQKQSSIIRSIIKCGQRQSYKVVLLIPRTSALYKSERGYFESLKDTIILTRFPEICQYIGQKANIVKDKFSGEDFFDPDTDAVGDKTLVIMVDADEIYKMMAASSYTQEQAWHNSNGLSLSNQNVTQTVFPATNFQSFGIHIGAGIGNHPFTSRSNDLVPNTDYRISQEAASQLDSLEARIAQKLQSISEDGSTSEVREGIADSFAGEDRQQIAGYNATDDLGLLIDNGYKLNLHTIMIMDNSTHLRSMRTIKLDGNFNHRIALPMSADEANYFMSQSRVLREYNNAGRKDCAFYSNRGGREQCFRPYVHNDCE